MGNFCGCESYQDPFEFENVPLDTPPSFRPPNPTHLVPIKVTKPKPPFSNINSFNIAAEVLAFFGYAHQAEVLLRKLDHNSRGYYVGHKEIIQNFVKTSREIIR